MGVGNKRFLFGAWLVEGYYRSGIGMARDLLINSTHAPSG